METKIIRLDCRKKATVEKTVTVDETPPTVDIPDSEFPLLGTYCIRGNIAIKNGYYIVNTTMMKNI